MRTYGQYCPIARTAELFAERWTPIIVRNLASGCTTFTQLREGAPGIPKALLADRLTQLKRHGIVVRRPRVEMCTSYPGRDEDLIVTTDTATLASWNLRRVSFDEAVRNGRCRLQGLPEFVAAFPTWIRPSPFAHVAPAARPAPRRRSGTAAR
jgi:HxlR-like helix-turn-helix protein